MAIPTLLVTNLVPDDVETTFEFHNKNLILRTGGWVTSTALCMYYSSPHERKVHDEYVSKGTDPLCATIYTYE